jgi:ATP-binding cassette, subfamily B, bacterial PglK
MIKKILTLLTPKERRRAYLLLCMILVMAFLDVVGVASIMPFMAVLGNPGVVETNRWLAWAYQGLGFADPRTFLFFLGTVVFLALVASIGFKALTQYALLRFTHMRNHSLSCRLFQGYLGRPYAWFLDRHSADLGKSILSEVGQVINGVIIPFMQLLAHGIVALFLIALLVVVDPLLALGISVVLGGAYTVIFLTIRRYLTRIGQDRVAANKERFQVAQEALGGIKEVKVFGREQAFYSQFVKPSQRFATHQATNAVLSQLPRFVLEMIAFGGVLLVALYLLRTHGEFQKMLPVLALYAFAGYRLLPALQQLYAQVTKLRFTLPALDILYADIQEFRANALPSKGPVPAPLRVTQGITLENIIFTYPKADKPALRNLSLHIPAMSTVGLVGSTGSGKTTTVDLILGLLTPQSGQLLVDGEVTVSPLVGESVSRLVGESVSRLVGESVNRLVGESVSRSVGESVNRLVGESVSRLDSETVGRSDGQTVGRSDRLLRWQRTLGYVPQHIYLADDTVAANIAFGIPAKDIDMDAVIRAATVAELHGFVDKELAKGYQTLVGERGVRLSGGQRQRIGIARALYHNPQVLIMDEATSALDNVTERLVMQSIRQMKGQRTIILIAHRLTTVQECDVIFLLEQGKVVGQGTFEELERTNLAFHRMAKGAR